MSSENRIIKSGIVREFDLSEGIKTMTEYFKKAIQNNGNILFYRVAQIACIATFELFKKNVNYGPSSWNNKIGGNISKSTSKALKTLYKTMKNHVEELELSSLISEIPTAKNGNAERKIGDILICEHGNEGVNTFISTEVTYEYSKEDLFDMVYSNTK